MLGNNGLLPEGYRVRPVEIPDLERCVEMLNEAFRTLKGVGEMFTIADIGREWQTPGFNLATDTRLVTSPGDQIAGYCEVWDLLNPSVKVNVWGQTHPEHCGLGVGSYLLNWAENRAEQAVARAPEGARVVLQAGIPNISHAATKLYQDHGYQLIRHSWRMVIDLNQEPARPRWPRGITIRTMKAGQDEAEVLKVVRDAFRDHWGVVEVPFEEDYERWMHYIEFSDAFDASLWFLAMEGERIAGLSLCRDHNYDDHDMGWVRTLCVRREWRRRGIGLALLHHSFREFYQRGRSRVGLNVDAQNLTGATRLYQKAGMRPDPERQYDFYEKELRQGVELSTQNAAL